MFAILVMPYATSNTMLDISQEDQIALSNRLPVSKIFIRIWPQMYETVREGSHLDPSQQRLYKLMYRA